MQTQKSRNIPKSLQLKFTDILTCKCHTKQWHDANMHILKRGKNTLLICCLGLTVGVTACAKFSPIPSVDLRSMQGESQNSYQTKITEARASWMLGTDSNGNKYSLIVIGQRGKSESSADDLNYERLYSGAKIVSGKWFVSAVGSNDRYRIEAGAVSQISPKIKLTASTTHKNKYDGGEKQTTQKFELCYQVTKNLCGIGGYQVRSHGDGADFVEDEIIVGLSYGF